MHGRNLKTISVSAQITIWVLMFLFMPIQLFFQTNDLGLLVKSMPRAMLFMLPSVLVFYINYLALIPKSLLEGRKIWFWIGNILILALIVLYRWMRIRSIPIPEGVPENRMGMFSVGILYMFALQVILVLLAIGLQYMERYSALKEAEAKQKQKASEAELSWLKNQLNPHFLFNTLNNISSLTQFDSDRAQESIGQLSDLLRYALYETEEAFVPLASEVEFMENYISLMSLRCNDLTTVEQDFEVSSENIRIAPLLFISILENAFKHGVNARSKSFVNVSLRRSGDDIIFRCENSLFEKAGTDRIGSGIGIENLRRRLELIYPLKHVFKCGAVDDRYVAEITLKGICTGA